MEYDRFAATIGALYANFKNTMLASFLGKQGADIAAVQRLRVTGFIEVRSFTQAVANAAASYQTTLVNGTPTTARSQPLVTSLHLLASRNINDLIGRLATPKARPADVFTQPAGAIGLLLQQKLATPTLTSLDAAGRRWDSQKLATTLARDFAYQSAVDAAAAGIKGDLAEVVYANAAHANNGLVVSLTGAPGVTSFAAVRSSIFHVNASAQLRQYVHA